MRVVSGSARGKILQAVPGMDTRPTTDRVKESIFSIIQMQVRGARVLDLFAGTGQMGIEALSRGAKSAVFVDNRKAAAAVVQKNLQAARVEDRSKVVTSDFGQFVSTCAPQSFDLIFLDPPYGGKMLSLALNVIERFDILSPNGIIICESAVEDEWQTGLEKKKTYRYGTICVTTVVKPPQGNT